MSRKSRILKRKSNDCVVWKQVQVVPVAAGALGSVAKRLVDWAVKLDLKLQTQLLLTTILAETLKILPKKMDMWEKEKNSLSCW